MSKQNKGKGAAPLDERFSRITYDPSFKSMKKDQKKVKIDNRFHSVFTDKKFKVQAKTDKYGNKLEVEDGINKEMEEFYYKDDEDVEQLDDAQPSKKSKKDSKKDNKKQQSNKKSKKQQESEEEEESNDVDAEEDNSEDFEDASDEEENEHEGSFEWNEVSSSDDDIEFQDEEDDQEEFYYGVEKEKPVVSEASSSKFAVLNYDWMNINAQDLMLLFNSFKDKIGVIKRVSVYPSEFGLQQLELENMQGPKNIWKKQEQVEAVEEEEVQEEEQEEEEQSDKKKGKKSRKEKEIEKKKKEKENEKNKKQQKKHQDNESDDEFVNTNTKKMQKRQQKTLFESRKINLLNHTVTARVDDEQGDLDPVALREYERQRMRYYYAVVECDSKATAEKIYDACDGMEFEMSGIPIDLRFVPEDQVFPYDPKEVCDEVPSDSQVKNILNRSIGHTNTRLTWDQPSDRFKFMSDKMTEKDFDKIDWSKYVAPCDDDGDQDLELKEGSDDEEINMEDLDSDAELALLEEEALRQQQEIDNMNWKKSFDKKNRKKKEGEIEIKFNQGFDDLGNKILEKQKRKNETKYQTNERLEKDKKKQRKQEIKEKIKQHKNKKLGLNKDVEDSAEVRKQKSQLSLLVDKEDKTEVKVDIHDPRFTAVYGAKDFAIDPTSKYYNKEASAKILEEQIKQRKKRKLNEEL